MRRIGIVLLAILFLFVVFAGTAATKAHAVVVSTIVIGAVIAAMAAAGIGLTVSGMTSAQLQDWVSGKLNDWSTAIGGTVQDHIDNNLITVTGRGILSIGNAAAQGISSFISWLQNEDSLSNDSTIEAIPGVYYINGYQVGKLPYTNSTGTRGAYVTVGTAYVYFTGDGGYYTWKILSNNTNQAYAVDANNNITSVVLDQSYNGWNYNTSFPSLSIGSVIDGRFIHNIEPEILIGNGQVSQTGTSLDYVTETINVPTIETGDKWFIDVGADPGATVDTVTDEVIADTIEGTLTVSGEVADEEPPFEVSGPIGVSGLTEIFPFCIPFDVYALLSCLSAEPQTPIFTVRFVIPGVINQEFTIDLSPFSTIAQIVRTMELIAFAVGLALVTRERFLRS